jgi:hypothetical protein
MVENIDHSPDREAALRTAPIEDLIESFGVKLYNNPIRNPSIPLRKNPTWRDDPFSDFTPNRVIDEIQGRVYGIESAEELYRLETRIGYCVTHEQVIGQQIVQPLLHLFKAFGSQEEKIRKVTTE